MQGALYAYGCNLRVNVLNMLNVPVDLHYLFNTINMFKIILLLFTMLAGTSLSSVALAIDLVSLQ